MSVDKHMSLHFTSDSVFAMTSKTLSPRLPTMLSPHCRQSMFWDTQWEHSATLTQELNI